MERTIRLTADTPYTQYPIIEVKRLTTEFTMQDGATAVIGGLSRSTEEDVDSGIPYLRKIPWIGQKLFGWKSRGKVQKEILVFVTVGIADPANLPKDVGLPKNAILGREYVRGNQFEPGDREGPAHAVLKLDMSNIDERGTKTANDGEGYEKGRVTITPVTQRAKPEPTVEPKSAEPVAPVEPKPATEAPVAEAPAETVAPADQTPAPEPTAETKAVSELSAELESSTPIEPVAEKLTPPPAATEAPLISALAEEAKEG